MNISSILVNADVSSCAGENAGIHCFVRLCTQARVVGMRTIGTSWSDVTSE